MSSGKLRSETRPPTSFQIRATASAPVLDGKYSHMPTSLLTMVPDLDEKTLEDAANTGEMEYEKWPSLLEPLLQRLNQIVYTEFHTPRPYPRVNRQLIPNSPSQIHGTSTRDSNPAIQTPSTPVRNLPPVPPFPNSSATSTSHVPDSLPPSQEPSADAINELPSLLLQILHSVQHTLRTAFAEKPPHTIQRLAELVLRPTRNYRTLPAWLRAVDRVVSVSSSADIFPLSDTPPIVNGVNGDGGGGILWTNNDNRNGYDSNSLGSDESLGGALLTPIPWLRNGLGGREGSSEDSGHFGSDQSSSTDTLGDPLSIPDAHVPGADPLVPERPDGAVTQGELMRMEQEAGVVPVNPTSSNGPSSRTMAGAEEGLYMDEEGELVPHARGPDVVGSVDMGRVDGHDVEIRIGSPPRGEEEEEEDRDPTDPNDAQTVLPGGDNLPQSPQNAGEVDDFEIVLKETEAAGGGEEGTDDVDAMQVDAEGTRGKGEEQKSENEQDEDIVLVDADGKTDDDLSKADVSGENLGPDAVDTSTVT
ncbi:hypothetical protein PV08_03497 [Exophiala spinifera]|uniref:Uncharacterized protein n=1 Tax=Exophiala spinifera TaxID=91928 RepID=A0A0D2BJV6_9EURO|nr:uncharacterized protein PV08_03497 [Exophiala spinifera]KIW19203.1 hypothetical protein PV08_03497 [Exophiala spinifera]